MQTVWGSTTVKTRLVMTYVSGRRPAYGAGGLAPPAVRHEDPCPAKTGGSPPPWPRTERHSLMIDTSAPGRRKAVRATNESQRNQPSPDTARPTEKLLAGKGAPRSTPFDSDRLPKQAWTSLTRRRSLVQIQYGPPGFSKSYLPVRAGMRASRLRSCLLMAGHSVLVTILGSRSFPQPHPLMGWS